MPELPEVETYRRYLEATSLHQSMLLLEVEDPKLLTTDFHTLSKALIGNSFSGTHRVGKNLFVYTEKGPILHMHFGMTGGLEYYRDTEDRPKHARIVFHFSSGFKLGFLCPRKFERIGLVENIDAYIQLKKIGPDAFSVAYEDFYQRIKARKGLLKPVLMDQATVAGLGNWIVDEVLFQARVYPEKATQTLSDDEIRRLHGAIQLVLQTAVEQEAVYGNFPTNFLIHARAWDKSPYTDSKAHLNCPHCGSRIEISQVGGRTTYFCRSCQH
jgi:formamidopyrimidine-DNA glycosylase